jgi:cell division cycle 14
MEEHKNMKTENEDMNWVIPGKFLAFSSPQNQIYDKDGTRTFTPDDYGSVFKSWKINLVVRLNHANYEIKKFIKHGVNHIDLVFKDGSTPPDVSLIYYLRI